jgi:Sulfotransferase family
MGAAAMEAQIVDLLTQRLAVEDWYRRHPEIDEEQVTAPLVGLGLPRTGSTALACLLGEDPAARSLRNWEAQRPCPPPFAEPASVAERIALAEAAMGRRAQLFPRMVQMLPSTATSPTECQTIMGHDFKTQLFQAFAHVPGYTRWLEDEADLVPTYRYLKRVLKLLQWRGKAKAWRIKNPAHSLFIEALFEVIPSVADVYLELSQAYSDEVSAPALAAANIATWDKAMRRMIAFRGGERDSRFYDIAFAPFMRDPFPALEGLYRFIGEELTVETRERMQAWRDASPRDKHGRHRPDLEAFAIDPAALDARFAYYHQRFAGMFEQGPAA